MKKAVLKLVLALGCLTAAAATAQSASSGFEPSAAVIPAAPSSVDPYIHAHPNRGAVGGYVGPNGVRVMSVQQLRQSRDDTFAVLQGHIVSYIGDEKYVFADSTGQIRIDLSWEDLPYGTTFDQSRKVELSGELDRDFGYMEFDVKHMKLL